MLQIYYPFKNHFLPFLPSALSSLPASAAASPDVSVATPPPTPPNGANGGNGNNNNNNNNNSDVMHETILEENENDGWEKVNRMSRKKSGSLCSISSSTSSRSGKSS